MIKVSYDGKYPNACSGKLTVEVDGKVVFSQAGCCHSTGCVWFDKDWQEHIETGKLVFDVDDLKDTSWFTSEIEDAIDEELSKVHVCCGGCV